MTRIFHKFLLLIRKYSRNSLILYSKGGASANLDRIAPQGYTMAVEQLKTALIVIDGAEAIRKAAEELSAALSGYQTSVRRAESFAGTDILPAHAFFLGCETPEPLSFTYLDQMLQHINLAGRPCGVFSTDKKALKYLSRLVEASGAKAAEPLLIKDSSAASGFIQKWVQAIPASAF